jgi:hypothetical protein
MLDRIRRVFRDATKPLGSLWKWATSAPNPRQKSKRFKALSTWARKKWSQARGESRHVWDLRKATYRRKYRYFKKKADKPAPPNGVGTFDGKPVAAWWVPILAQARKSGLWGGTLTSGYRTPAYSQQLCYQICGAPSCPGRCAGTSSNHTKLDSSAAVDVSDPAGFARAMQAQGNGIFNALGAADPWHFSRSGR